LPGARWTKAPSGTIVSALVLTAVPLDALIVPVLPMEFEAWLRAALDAAELVEAATCLTEQAPLVVDVVIEAEAALVGVDEVIGENVDDELEVEEVDDDVVLDVVIAGADVDTAVPVVVVAVGIVDVGEVVVGEVEGDNALVEGVVVVAPDAVDDEPVAGAPPAIVWAAADAGEHAVMVDVGAGSPKTVPATALVVCVPLGGAPDVLTNMALRISAFCQYGGAASITTWY
jgi:hypothetical protein